MRKCIVPHLLLVNLDLRAIWILVFVFLTTGCSKEGGIKNDPPEAEFTASPIIIIKGESVAFTDESTNSPTSWTWDFGDEQTSVEQNPIHTYSEIGSYRVTLISSNTNGSDSETKEDYISVGLTGSVRDIEGSTYNTVLIGNQIWMAENLKTTKFNDGSAIPLISDNSTWGNITTPAFCWYDNTSGNKNPYGGLYNHFVVETGKVCPTGWHVPNNDEFDILVSYLGGYQVAGGKLKNMFFVGLPGGIRSKYGVFAAKDKTVYWWSATSKGTSPTSNSWGISINSISDYIFYSESDKQEGMSVRCVKD